MLSNELKDRVQDSVVSLLRECDSKADAEQYLDTIIEEDFDDAEEDWPELKAFGREFLKSI